MFLASLSAGAASVLGPLRPNKVWAPDLPLTLTNWVISFLESQLPCLYNGNRSLMLQVAHVPEPVSRGIHLGLLKPTEFLRGLLQEPLGVVRLLLPGSLRGGEEMPALPRAEASLSRGENFNDKLETCGAQLCVISAPGGFPLQGTKGLEKPPANPALELWDIKCSSNPMT